MIFLVADCGSGGIAGIGAHDAKRAEADSLPPSGNPAGGTKLWAELSAIPDEFTLYGGTALALHLGHRSSVDFDFFQQSHDRPGETRERNSISERCASHPARKEYPERNHGSRCIGEGFRFFGVPKLPRLAASLVVEDNALKIASLLDLAGTKASVVQVRAEAKDYIDMDALIHFGGIGLPSALAAAQKLYGSS